MASSGKSKRSSRGEFDLAAHVATRLQDCVAPGQRLLLGLSGGVDSIVLLDLLAQLRPALGYELRATHVNHQLSPNSAQWARFCRAACAARGVPCRVVKVDVVRGNSTERAAREARYDALRSARADVIALAHNADDQAETVLLQLLRGAGVKGLSAMPLRNGPIVRPLLEVPRSAVERYAVDRGLEWVEDESNTDQAYLRNWLRGEVMPRIAARVPGYRATLIRAARHFSDAAELLDALARSDADEGLERARIPLTRLRSLSPARARNVVRFMIGCSGWPMPETDRLDEALRQALCARADARVAVDLGACELRRHGGFVHLVPVRTACPGADAVTWNGERKLELPHLGGILTMLPRRGAGLSVARLQGQPVTVRARRGGERLRPDAERPTRTVKNLMQEARVPVWERETLPFIYSGETLVCVPGVAADHRFRAQRGERSVLPGWSVCAFEPRASP